MTLPLAGLAVVLVAALTWAHLAFWTRRLTLPMPYARVEELRTADGATIELRRLRELPAEGSVPVLLVHGLGANHRNNDLHPEFSLARHLEAEGRDVWLLTLRSGRKTPGPERALVRFDAMARYDLPTAIETVRSRTGASRIDYLGFSMGGLLLYAALARTVDEGWLRRVVICASPGSIGVPRPLRWLAARLPRGLVPGAPLRVLARLFAFASEWLPKRLRSGVVNHANVPEGLTRAALVNLVEDIPASLQADFVSFAKEGFVCFDGRPALDGLRAVRVPALFLAGSVDGLAPIRSVRRAFEAWGAERDDLEKRFVALGRAYGHEEDYGHGDLAFGRHVAREVFPLVSEFFGAEAAGGEAVSS
ncbi:MAG: alpha/beta fold hydrolase [Deltaproteobacteria bacterium]|nr:alpha/beta fold hydrolase [Deltaproteobacteria bacterium]